MKPLLIPMLLMLLQVPVLASDDPVEPMAQVTERYQPTHQSPQQLIDALKPLFGDSVAFSTDGRVILIRGPATALAEITELLPGLDHPPRRYRVELRARPVQPNARTYATEPRDLSRESYTVTENAPLTLVREQQAQTLDGGHLLWNRVATMPVQREAIQLQVSGTDEAVIVQVSMRTLRDGRWRALDNTVSAAPGQWVPLAVEPQPTGETDNGTTTRTTQRDTTPLLIRITPL